MSVTDRPVHAAGCLLMKESKVLCVWNQKYQGWTLPGGKVELGEGGQEAALRELREETGIIVPHDANVSLFYRGLGVVDPKVYIETYLVMDWKGVACTRELGNLVEWQSIKFLVNLNNPFSAYYLRMFAANA